jgi:hypothetical protein
MSLRGYDAWLTTDRSLDWEPPPHPKCGHCGAFLPLKPTRVENKADVLHCDGVDHTSPEEYSEGLIAILGEEYRSKTYDVHYSDCGLDVGPHEPHDEVQHAWAEIHRTCTKCGHDDVEVDA